MINTGKKQFKSSIVNDDDRLKKIQDEKAKKDLSNPIQVSISKTDVHHG